MFTHRDEAYLELVMDAGKISQILVQNPGIPGRVLVNGVLWWIEEAACTG